MARNVHLFTSSRRDPCNRRIRFGNSRLSGNSPVRPQSCSSTNRSAYMVADGLRYSHFQYIFDAAAFRLPTPISYQWGHMRSTRSVSAAVLALLFTAACDPSDQPVSPQPGDASLDRASSQASFHTPDDEFARVSRAEVPGFAGFYLQSDGTPVIRLKDQAQRGAAQRYLAQQLAAAHRGRLAMAPRQ